MPQSTANPDFAFEVGKSYTTYSKKSYITITKRSACYVSGVEKNGETFRRQILKYAATYEYNGDGKVFECFILHEHVHVSARDEVQPEITASAEFAQHDNLYDDDSCVIVGFTSFESGEGKFIYDENGRTEATHINPYLYDAPDMWITNRMNQPRNGISKMTTGSPPTDDGGLLMTSDEKRQLEAKYPVLSKYIRPFIGAREFLHDKVGEFSRYCLWFKGGNPSDYANIPEIKARLEKVKAIREHSNADRIRKMADYPYLFCQIRQPSSMYLVIPRHSSENRKYIPIDFMPSEVIAGDACSIIPDVSIYEFGVLTSSVHMAWVRVVAGRLEMRIRYSPAVYNNFVWPSLSEKQRAKIEMTAQKILYIRAKYPDSTLADLYAPLTMPEELLKAHKANDAAVCEAYGWLKNISEEEIVAGLFRLYHELMEGISLRQRSRQNIIL